MPSGGFVVVRTGSVRSSTAWRPWAWCSQSTVGSGLPGAFDRNRPELAYGMRAPAPFMAGWTILLLWADRKPLERQDVVAMTAVPMVAGLRVGDIAAVRAGHVAARSILPTRVLQSALLALFAVSYARGRAATRQMSAEGVVASALDTANPPPGRKGSSS